MLNLKKFYKTLYYIFLKKTLGKEKRFQGAVSKKIAKFFKIKLEIMNKKWRNVVFAVLKIIYFEKSLSFWC